jgi:hypothetical protein
LTLVSQIAFYSSQTFIDTFEDKRGLKVIPWLCFKEIKLKVFWFSNNFWSSQSFPHYKISTDWITFYNNLREITIENDPDDLRQYSQETVLQFLIDVINFCAVIETIKLEMTRKFNFTKVFSNISSNIMNQLICLDFGRNTIVTDRMMTIMIKECHHLNSLTMTAGKTLKNHSLIVELLRANAKAISKLTLVDCNVTFELVVMLQHLSTQLSYLHIIDNGNTSLQNVSVIYNVIYLAVDLIGIEFFRYQLLTLHCEGNRCIYINRTNKLRHLFHIKNFACAEVLSLINCISGIHELCMLALYSLPESGLSMFPLHNPDMYSCAVMNCDDSFSETELTAFIKLCPKLVAFCLEACHHLSGLSIVAICSAKQFTALVFCDLSLTLEFCHILILVNSSILKMICIKKCLGVGNANGNEWDDIINILHSKSKTLLVSFDRFDSSFFPFFADFCVNL